jgi:dihydroorotate dehydrogenase
MRAMDALYTHALKLILFKMSPDTVHDLFITAGEAAGKLAPTRALFSALYNYSGPDISKTVDGVTYRTPILLSAGFDANGRLTRILPSLGFGGEEVGSVTADYCEGNPLPRMTRLVRNRSLVVYKGLRNHGVDALIKKLKVTPRLPTGKAGEKGFVIGISIARTNSISASTDIEAGIKDYETSFRKLNEAGIGDYYTINISCPNAFTGEAFTDPAHLAKLLPRLAAVACDKPVYLKMPISFSWEEFDALLQVASSHSFIRGVIIGNLNKHYSELKHPEDAPKEFRGGLSGEPTQKRSTEYIKKTRAAYGARFTIIGCGGIFTLEDALEKLHAGADLLHGFQNLGQVRFGDQEEGRIAHAQPGRPAFHLVRGFLSRNVEHRKIGTGQSMRYLEH